MVGRVGWVGEGLPCMLSAAAALRSAFAIACRAACGGRPLARALPPQAVGQRVAAGQNERENGHRISVKTCV